VRHEQPLGDGSVAGTMFEAAVSLHAQEPQRMESISSSDEPWYRAQTFWAAISACDGSAVNAPEHHAGDVADQG
jgi:hypothetical protein